MIPAVLGMLGQRLDHEGPINTVAWTAMLPVAHAMVVPVLFSPMKGKSR